MARLEIKNSRRPTQDLTVLDELNLSVEAGEAVAIRGSSGTGKSTLLNCIGLLDRPDSGEIFLNGTKVNYLSKSERGKLRAEQLGFVFQAFHLLPEFSVIENILLAARCADKSVKQFKPRAVELLKNGLIWAIAKTTTCAFSPAANASGSPSAVPCSYNRRLF